jgi:hypothetical protein
LALGFLALAGRSEDVRISLPLDLAARLADAADHPVGAGASLAPDGALTGSRAAVRELLAVAIDEAGEHVSLAATALLRGEGTAAELRAALAEAGALLDLRDSL